MYACGQMHEWAAPPIERLPLSDVATKPLRKAVPTKGTCCYLKDYLQLLINARFNVIAINEGVVLKSEKPRAEAFPTRLG